jgi:hypothetical protein
MQNDYDRVQLNIRTPHSFYTHSIFSQSNDLQLSAIVLKPGVMTFIIKDDPEKVSSKYLERQ